MKFDDIVALAKAGYSPKQVKELLEMVETSPQIKDANPDDVVNVDTKKVEPTPEPKKDEEEDPIDALKKLLNE